MCEKTFLKVVKVFKQDAGAQTMLTDLLQETLGKKRVGNTVCMQDRYLRAGEWRPTLWGTFVYRLEQYDAGKGHIVSVRRALVEMRRAYRRAHTSDPESAQAAELREGFELADKFYTIVTCT